MESYPIMLNIRNKDAVVVGGGKIAYRKMSSLIQAGANVTVISPNLDMQVKKLVDEKKVRWHKKKFERADLASALIVIAATDNKEVNEQVVQFSSKHQLVNVVDNSVTSNFRVPAKLTRGKLTIAVSTEGASPALAKKIRDELTAIYDESYEAYLEFLALARAEVLAKVVDETEKSQLLNQLINVDDYKLVEKQKKFFEGMMIADDKA